MTRTLGIGMALLVALNQDTNAVAADAAKTINKVLARTATR